MAKPVDLELKKAFAELQVKMVETSKKIQIIDSQINMIEHVFKIVDATQKEILKLPPGTKTYDSVGRMFLFNDLEDVRESLKNRVTQLSTRTTELKNNKQYLEKNLKESEDNIREMVQQRKEQIDTRAN